VEIGVAQCAHVVCGGLYMCHLIDTFDTLSLGIFIKSVSPFVAVYAKLC